MAGRFAEQFHIQNYSTHGRISGRLISVCMDHTKNTIILIQPWVEDFYHTDCRTQPIGLAYLAASIRRRFQNLDIVIYDVLSDGNKKSIPWPVEFHYLEPYYGSPDRGSFNLFHHYYRFGKSEEQIINDLSGLSPLLIGISSLFTPYYRQSLAMALICKKIFPDVEIVMGGSHATMHPESLLNAEFKGIFLCDFILRGEAEDSICELIEAVLELRSFSDVTNLVTRESLIRSSDDKIADGAFRFPKSPDMNSLAIPEFPGLSEKDYTLKGRPMTFLITGRSCPHQCTFCSIHSVFGKKFRVRNAGSVIEEIKKRFNEGVRHFDIEDDNFTANGKNAAAILNAVAEMNLPITMSAMNGLSYHSLDENILELMKRAGFTSLNLSLVSSDKDILSLSNRPHTVEKFKNIIRYASELDLPVTAYYILGMPGQTIAEMLNTLFMLAGEQCLIGASPFYFTPGSPIHSLLKNDPSIKLASSGGDPYFSARLTAMDVETIHFTREDIYTLFRLTRLINHIKAGIDRDLNFSDAYFENAVSAVRSGQWYFENKNKVIAAPFSRKVFESLQGREILICGHRNSKSLRLDYKEFLP